MFALCFDFLNGLKHTHASLLLQKSYIFIRLFQCSFSTSTPFDAQPLHWYAEERVVVWGPVNKTTWNFNFQYTFMFCCCFRVWRERSIKSNYHLIWKYNEFFKQRKTGKESRGFKAQKFIQKQKLGGRVKGPKWNLINTVDVYFIEFYQRKCERSRSRNRNNNSRREIWEENYS